jgi:DNA invertase Pin-like site-specific DNA recombinase
VRVYGYVRVSKEREGMVSPDLQADEINRHCATRGWTVLETFTDIDLSGKLPPEKRPGLQELLSRATAGGCDTVVVYRVDRLSREPADYYAIRALLQNAGVGIDAAAQPKEASPEGELMWDLSAVLARYESLKLGARLKDMHRRLATTGRWAGGIVPYGWRSVKGEDGTRLVLEPEEAQWRRWMHEQYHAGWSCLRIARHLNARGVATRKGGTWSDGLVWNMLRSPYQVGARQTEDGLRGGGNVEPLLSEETYERTLALMEARHTRRGRVGSHAIPARLARCGNCGGALAADSHNEKGRSYAIYSCGQRKRGTCDRGVSVRYDAFERYVLERLFAHLQGARATRRRAPSGDVSPLLAEIDKIRDSLTKLAVMRSEGELGEEEYAAARLRQRKRQDSLEAQVKKATDGLEGSARERLLEETWTDLAALTSASWDALPVQARRDIVELVIEKIVVDPLPPNNTRAPAGSRIRIRWR